MTKEDCWDFIMRSGALDSIRIDEVSATDDGKIWATYFDDLGDCYNMTPYTILYHANPDVHKNDSYLISQEDVDWLIQKCDVVIRNKYRQYLQQQLDYIEGIV